MLKHVFVTCIALAVGGSAAFADKPNEKAVPMCPVKVTMEVPCSNLPSAAVEAPPVKVEKPVQVKKVVSKSDDEVCVEMCVGQDHWDQCESRPKSWFANMKGHPKAKPLNDQATRYSTQRFFTRCGIDCRPRGTMRFGHESEYTGKWTVFRYGHKAD